MLALTALVAGCAEDSNDPAGPAVTVRITHDYGRELLSEERVPLAEGRTVLRAVRYRHAARPSASGGTMRSIDGMREGHVRGRAPRNWILTVNGIESDAPPAEYRLRAGDVVQWDFRPIAVTIDSRAMVGSLPQMLTRGVGGRPFRVSLDCWRERSGACREVRQLLEELGATRARAGASQTRASSRRTWRPRARVLVAPWRHVRDFEWRSLVTAPTDYSGIYMRFAADGRRIQLLDWRGRARRTETASTGAIVAMSSGADHVVLLVSGTDARGVARAASALRSPRLAGAYSAVVTRDGGEKLPLAPR